MQAMKQAFVPVSENGEEEEEEEAEFGEEDLFHQQVRTPSPQLGERRLQPSLCWGQSVWGPVCLLGNRLPNSRPHLCRGTRGLPRGVAG